MLEVLEKIILAGVGLVSMTKEKAEELVDVLIKKGQVKAKDRSAALSKLLRGTEKFDKDLEKKMKQVSSKIVKSSEMQIDRIKKKLTKIAKDLHFEKKKSKINSKNK